MLKLELANTVKGGWGPPLRLTADDAPTFPIDNITRYPPARVGKACDFTQATQERIRQMSQKVAEGGMQQRRNNFLMQQQPLVVEDGYALVDTKSAAKKRQQNYRNSRPNYQAIQAAKNIKTQNYQQGILGQNKKIPKKAPQIAAKGKGKGKGKGYNNRNAVPMFRDWSVSVKPDWEMVSEHMLGSFAKMSVDQKLIVSEDIMTAGPTYNYDKKYDRVNARLPKPLPIADTIAFYNPTSADDDVLRAIMQDDESIEVIGTDHIFAVLMAASRSVYSWDIIITKLGNKLVFDKRDGSAVDLLTVSETSPEPPTYDADKKHDINGPLELGREAARVNQNFSQAVLDLKSAPFAENEAHPFAEEGEESEDVSGTSYLYRKVTLPGNKKATDPLKFADVTIALRTEVQAVLGENKVAARCLNEDPSNKNKQLTWSKHLESQAGAVLAMELRQNSFKMGRWIAEAMMSGSETFKLGYAVRTTPTNPWSHAVINVQTNPTKQFATQINLTESTAWGVIRFLIDLVRAQATDGKYVLVKDPNKPIVRLYSVPWDAFDGDDDEEEEEEEEDDEEDDEDA